MKKLVFIFTIIMSVALPKNVFAQGTIVDVAVNNKDFSTLVTALKAAEVNDKKNLFMDSQELIMKLAFM